MSGEEESVYLIWKLVRCERVIQKDNSPFSEREVEARWEVASRQTHDKPKVGRKGVSKQLVKAI